MASRDHYSGVQASFPVEEVRAYHFVDLKDGAWRMEVLVGCCLCSLRCLWDWQVGPRPYPQGLAFGFRVRRRHQLRAVEIAREAESTISGVLGFAWGGKRFWEGEMEAQCLLVVGDHLRVFAARRRRRCSAH